MSTKWIELSLAITTFLSGLSGGIGFFTAMGGNPALVKLSDHSFAEYWQQIDGFMGARMPIFGPLLLFAVMTSTILLFKEWRTVSFWLMLSAFFVVIGDIAFTLNVNHPLNRLIQGWDLSNLPSDVQDIKMKVIKAFNVRLLLMMGAFFLVVLSVWLRKK
ncbi:DUF1772 domain-containing protein [Chitinophaga sp. SYP-B3965]|uniref:DUF1772 domain-containing protein n=1 Tax=Chitinophaga sp. SYP-B3965 TaxID=2663120 RepID=UPI0012997033|nr:DUF1772 domain-containing protein [Chitinophaga sp. SYP-B3965]MRG48786.1 DUF1772 domain-containing protein [Chitinophaga sp. SYP-B3965]